MEKSLMNNDSNKTFGGNQTHQAAASLLVITVSQKMPLNISPPLFFMGHWQKMVPSDVTVTDEAFQSQLYETRCSSGLHVHRGLIQAGRKLTLDF